MPFFVARSTTLLVRGGVIAAAVATAITVPQVSASADSTQYAALALSTSTGSTGRAWNYPSPGEARDAAINSCNEAAPAVQHPGTGSAGPYTTGGDCDWKVWIESGECAAIVQSTEYDPETKSEGTSWYTSGRGSTRDEADYNAIQKGTGHRSQILNSVCQD
ncbi:DUF4189 domain-containing protein [Nocardia sp. NPDC049526]|uniref:DUF4189 domain-containing protein n=1 Tax=Nocardia sp. NPDC049526 TaxID=3364316 RepID=UPI0037B1F6CF